MHYHIFVENHPNQGYVATVLGWPDCVGAGATKEEAIARAHTAIAERLARGEIIRLQMPETDSADPWEPVIGQFIDDPAWDDFQSELCRIREEANRA